MIRLKHTINGVVINVADGKSVPGFRPFGDPAETEIPGYDGLKVSELKPLIEKRNEGRDDGDKLSTEGLKADLIAILAADDAKAAGSDN